MLLPTTWVTHNENILLPKIWVICRICLEQHEVMLDINEKVFDFYIWEMLRDCGGVPVRKDDNFPDKICKDCLQGLWKSNKFRLKCQRGNRHLINIFLERNLNIYEQDIVEEAAACSEIVNLELPPPQEAEEKDDLIEPLKTVDSSKTIEPLKTIELEEDKEKDAIIDPLKTIQPLKTIEPLKSIELPDTNVIPSLTEFNIPLKTSEDLEFLDINDEIKIKSDTNEIKNSEKIQAIEIHSESIKHYCIVRNPDESDNQDKDEQKRIVLLLKVQNETNATTATNDKPKAKSPTKQNSKTQIKKPKNQRKTVTRTRKPSLTKNSKSMEDMPNNKPKRILRNNSKIQTKLPTKVNNKKTSDVQITSKIITKTKRKSTQKLASESTTKRIKLSIKSETATETAKKMKPTNKSETTTEKIKPALKSNTATNKVKPAIKSKTAAKNIKLKRSRKVFSCRICKKRFKTEVLLRHHHYTHTKPYTCRICGKSYSQTHLYKSHYNTHTGEKPFSCRICQRRFSDESNRNTHERKRHKNEMKEYKCQECNAKFRFRKMLESHKNVHKSTECGICGKLLGSYATLRYHLQRSHLKKLIKKENKCK